MRNSLLVKNSRSSEIGITAMRHLLTTKKGKLKANRTVKFSVNRGLAAAVHT